MIVRGTVRVPGDKSITHRALLFGALARGTSHVGGALTSLDARSSARVLRQLGASVSSLAPDRLLTVIGRGRLRAPDARLHCGNSGTTTRLLLGMLASHRFTATLTGDASLRRRPMRRVTEPLARMGARFTESGHDGLPLTIRGGTLAPLTWELPVSSAQLKSAILLAGLTGEVPVSVREPHGRSRDHTERMLEGFGYGIRQDDEGWVHFTPGGRIEPFDLQVPGDISSAAFLLGLALLAEGGELALAGVGVNPTRTGILDVIARMGGTVTRQDEEVVYGEPVATLVTGPAALRAATVEPQEIPRLIDEIPLLAVLASRAEGTSVFREVGELRVKESDRLALIAENLRTVGARAEVVGNDLHVEGRDFAPAGRVRTAGDHRLAMAFGVLGTVPGAKIRVDDPDCAAVSFPGFWELLRTVRARR